MTHYCCQKAWQVSRLRYLSKLIGCWMTKEDATITSSGIVLPCCWEISSVITYAKRSQWCDSLLMFGAIYPRRLVFLYKSWFFLFHKNTCSVDVHCVYCYGGFLFPQKIGVKLESKNFDKKSDAVYPKPVMLSTASFRKKL